MKKLVALLLATAMMFTCVACGGNSGEGGNTEGNEGGTKVEITDATEVLTKAWEEYNNTVADDMKFAVGGGNLENFELVVMGSW